MEFKKNDILTLTIEDIGIDGEGIGKVDGYTLFVKDAVVGDTVSVKIMKAKKNYAYAHLEQVLTPSPFRIQAPCPIHKACGGCQIQNLSYEEQLRFKEKKVKNNLLRLGGFTEEELKGVFLPIVGMDGEGPFRYRNKAQFPVGTNRDGKIISGFYAGRTHSIIQTEDCLLGVSENKDILAAVIEYMSANRVAPYNEETGKGLVRHVLIRKGFTSGQLMVCIVVNSSWKGDRTLPAQTTLIKSMQELGVESLSINCNTENTNVILGKETHTIAGLDTIEDTLHLFEIKEDAASGNVEYVATETGITYAISPQSFFQVNPVQTEKLYSLALDYAGLTGQEIVWDLYCGIGTISLFMAGKAKKVCGVEIIPQAIVDAKENAKRNNITNAEFYVGKAEEVLPAYYENPEDPSMTSPDVIVVDPPRKGCDKLCLDTMLKMAPQRIVYVSCDSATLARDLAILVEGGYKLEKVRPVDQFPHTVHVESVCLLSKVQK